MPNPRVTIGIATYRRDTYLAEAIDSCLAQDHDDFEVLVVVDGSPAPEPLEAVLAAYAGDPRLRVVRHERNLHIAAAYNTIAREGRGELIAMLGDDDVCLPDRISRSVELFDRHPDTGVVHGDAAIIDADGREVGTWRSGDLAPGPLLELLVRRHNYLIDPTRMVHRRVHEALGGYRDGFRTSQDFDFWLRAAPDFRFRHVEGGPVIALRRHDDNLSGEAQRGREVEEVQRALRDAFDCLPLRRLVPELDWGVLHPRRAERRAWEVLADALESRELPLPELAAELRERARAVPLPPAPRPNGRRIVLTSFGFEDSGGGTLIPRVTARELANRGWDVTVFHAAVRPDPSGVPYTIRESEQDGVRLVAVHNREHGLFDLRNPHREIEDPPITAAFAETLDRVRPDVVHAHNLHNLGAALLDEAAARGIRTFFTPHNHWLLCPRGYMLDGRGALCPGPGDGTACAPCVGSHDVAGHQDRFAELRARVVRGVDSVLAVSEPIRRTLLAAAYPAEMVDVVRQSVPAVDEIWERVGRDRAPGRLGEPLTVAFVGSAYPHKGPQLLVEAAQRTDAELRVVLHGEVPAAFAERLRRADGRGVVDLRGPFSPSELPDLLAGVDVAVAPSILWETAGLVALECLAARVPLVVPRLGGLAEAVRDGIDGLVFAPHDVDDLARQLDRLASEPGLLERLQSGIERPRAFAAFVDDLEACYAGERPGRIAAPAAEVAVDWVGEQEPKTSLATINREVTRRLPATGVRLRRRDRDGRALDPALPHAADVEVRHMWPPELSPPRAGRVAVIQPWEFGSIPRDWAGPMREHVDEVWVPSAYVARMYLDAGLDPDRLHVVPNGVDVERFRPDGPRYELDAPEGLRLLFLGGAIKRKGIDVLLEAYRAAFEGRDDVTLVVKDTGIDGAYRKVSRDGVREASEDASGPRVLYLTDELGDDDLAALYRACDVLVHPYRGEGFAMPVLEAMATGLPVIVTAGGPTDEFCPEDAGWRIRSTRLLSVERRIDSFDTVGDPWLLEPDAEHLVELMREAVASPEERRARGERGRAAAQSLSWERVAEAYAERLAALARRAPRSARPLGADQPAEWAVEAACRVLATPAWRGTDRLAELLAAWAQAAPAGTDACLELLADPAVDGAPAELEAHVIAAAAAAGADLDGCADIDVLMLTATADRDVRLHEGADAYVPLHAACAGHERLARAAGSAVVEPSAETLRAVVARVPAAA